ncbi:MAG: NAD(P)H-dependent oxidoreductase [Chitinophagaceae bacterium]|nr:NAD(P)H-dependent oxidoreductase [Chitinophagaceae bacterium]
MAILENLKWRYATKKYDPAKKISKQDIDTIVEAARLAPTSSGLQQFRVFVISDQDLKNKIVPIANGQQIVADSSHLLVFAAWDKYTAERIDSIYDLTTDERSLPRGRFSTYTDKLKNLYLTQTAEQNFVHTSRQAYIGFSMAIAAAAELKIDSTPMEGFNTEALDELLGLKEKGLKSVLMLPLGYRDAEGDWLHSMKKVRNPKEEFVVEL